jgi:hypothetical protein
VDVVIFTLLQCQLRKDYYANKTGGPSSATIKVHNQLSRAFFNQFMDERFEPKNR